MINWIWKWYQKAEMCVHLVINKVISSQPVPHLQFKNFFSKSFSTWSIKLEYAIRKIKWVFIWSQIKSFCHNLFLTSNPKTSFAKVSTFDQLNMNMISKNWKYVHMVKNQVISSQPVTDLQSKNFYSKSFSIWSITF